MLVEGATDEAYISKALEVFQKERKYMDLDFSYLPCNGSTNVQRMIEKFHPKPNQLMIALFDNDGAGWSSYNGILGLCNEGKTKVSCAQKKDDIWLAIIPALKGRKGNFNIEDYFPHKVFLKFVMSFQTLNEIVEKNSLKSKLANMCKRNELLDSSYSKFAVLFDFIKNIKQAESEGKYKI